MRTTIIIIMALLCSLGVRAQKRVSFIDEESRIAIPNVIIADSVGEIARGSAQGMAIIPKKHSGKIILVQPNYERMTIDYDSIPAVIQMKHITYTIDDVNVFGEGQNKIDPNAFTYHIDPTEEALAKANPGSANLLGLVAEGISALWKLTGIKTSKQKKLSHKEKLKEILDNY